MFLEIKGETEEKWFVTLEIPPPSNKKKIPNIFFEILLAKHRTRMTIELICKNLGD